MIIKEKLFSDFLAEMGACDFGRLRGYYVTSKFAKASVNLDFDT